MYKWELFLALQNTSSMASKKSLKTIGFKISNSHAMSQRLGFTPCPAIITHCVLLATHAASLNLSNLSTEARRVIFFYH